MSQSNKGIKKKGNMSNIDISIIVKELNEILSEGFIDNIYEINDNLLQIKCRTKTGKRHLILDASKRINFTNYAYPVPPFPSQYCTALRKYMKGRRILSVSQYELDRIVIFELHNKDGDPWKFIVELFLGGNFLLIDDQNKIFMAKKYKIMRDRRILAKKPYEYPTKRGKNFHTMTLEDLKEILANSEKEVVRTIARETGLAGYLAEEVCLRGDIPKKTKCSDITEEQSDILFNNIKTISKQITDYQGNQSVVYYDQDKEYVAFEPFELLKYKEYSNKQFQNYNEAVDEYFSKIDSKQLLSNELKASEKVLGKFERIKTSQEQQIEESKKKRENHLDMGNLLYEHMTDIENLLNVVKNARKKGMEFKEIEERLKIGKEKGIPEAKLFDRFYPKEAKLSVKIDEIKIKLDFRKNVHDNATEYYKLAKKDKRRIAGAAEALKKTEKTIQEKQFEKDLREQEQVSLVKRPKKQWFEKFRWFKSSDGFLIVGGKDASSNEAVVKKYLEKEDLFFHTELRGAPCVILKNPDGIETKEIPQLTIKETATFAASYSNAWREGWGSTKIFYVTPDQVTKSPNPGEFLAKGAFFIKGSKNFLPKPYIELAIGLILEPVGKIEEDIEDEKDLTTPIDEESTKEQENTSNDTKSNQSINEDVESEEQIAKTIYFPRIIAGPLSSVKSKTDNLVRIKPQKSSKLRGGKLADKIKIILINQTPENKRKWAKLIAQNDVMHFLPPGGSDIAKKK